MTIKQKMRN